MGHDPLRERRVPGRWNASTRRVAGSMVQRTSGLGGDRPDALQSAASSSYTAVVVQFPPQPRLPEIGHNGGPLLAPDDPNESWRAYCWRRARKAAWKTPPREIALRRLERAEALGITYHDYTLEILERGRYL